MEVLLLQNNIFYYVDRNLNEFYKFEFHLIQPNPAYNISHLKENIIAAYSTLIVVACQEITPEKSGKWKCNQEINEILECGLCDALVIRSNIRLISKWIELSNIFVKECKFMKSLVSSFYYTFLFLVLYYTQLKFRM